MMLDSSSHRRIDRMSSIETEPRTLMFHQIHDAREAALFVLNTKTIEEAISIFTQGLEPVLNIGNMVKDTNNDIEMLELLATEQLGSMREDIVSAPF